MNMEEVKQIIAEAFEKERKENGEEKQKTKNSSL